MFTEYSPLWLLPIVCAAGAIAYFAYFFRRKDSYLTWQRNTLAVFRFLSVLLVLFLLVSPVVRMTKNIEQKPIVVIAQDDSSSIMLTKDSAYYRNKYMKDLSDLTQRLSDKYDVRFYAFGAKSRELDTDKAVEQLSFKESRTDISKTLEQIAGDYFSQNLSAVVIVSDGINNSGGNPLNTCEDLAVPIYSVAMGDTSVRKDLAISHIRCNKIAYLDDEFPIEITLSAVKAAGERTQINLWQAGQRIFTQSVEVKGDKFSLTIPCSAVSSKVGVRKFVVEVAQCPNETNKENNRREFFVEILDSRSKIRILSAAVHPDISAIKQSISKNKNYTLEAEVFSERNQKEDGSEEVVVAHSLPCDVHSFDYLNGLQQRGTPVLYILGSATDYTLFNRLNAGVQVSVYNLASQSQSQALFNRNFTLFSFSEPMAQVIEQMPPLEAPLARFTLSNATSILAYQNIKGLKTDYPLLCFYNNPLQKCAVFCCENIWKWRLQNYLLNRTSDEVDEILQKSIQYLVSGANKSLFRLKHEKVFSQSDPIFIEAELYNQSFEPINTPEVQISILSSKGEEFKYTFSKTNSAYSLNAGIFQEGEYTYTAMTEYSGTKHTAKGSFVVSSSDLEAVNLVADHTLLRTLSRKTGGAMINVQSLQSIDSLLQSNEQIRPVIHSEITLHKLIESLYYWLAIIILLSAEWFLRKFWGRI